MNRSRLARRFVRLVAQTLEDRTAPAIFGPADSTVNVGTQPQSMAVADFNGDGKQDLAVANVNGNQLTILLGNGSGGFSPAAGSPIAINRPYFVVAGDFNGDGKPDLAVANNFGASGTVTVLLGNGSGGFSQAVVATGDSLVSVAVGDFNGDGKQDIAATNNISSGTVTALLGNGSGGFSPAPGSPFAVGNGPRSVAVGDFNGDGKQDLAVTNYGSNDLTILLGDGSGGFSPAVGSPIFVGINPNFLAVGDFNGDGFQDLAVPNAGGNTVTVLLGSASGAFIAASGSPVTVGASPSSVAVGDFNGDGKPDLAITDSSSNNLTVLLGNGDGTFSPAACSPVAAGSVPYFVAAGDFNADGKQDLAVADYIDNDLSIYLNHGPVNTSASLASSGSPSVYGQVVVFTATVTANAPSTATPTGIVSFFDGGTLLGAGALSGGLATISTSALSVGSHNITASFNGNAGFNASPVSNTVVQQVNGLPTIGGVPGFVQMDELTLLTFTATDTNAGPTPTFSLTGAPTGAVIDPSSGGFTWTPTEALGPGTFEFTVRLVDGTSTDDRQITVMVNEVNTAPVLGALPTGLVTAPGSPITFTATATDSDIIHGHGSTLTYSLVGPPAGAFIDPDTGAFTWTPGDFNLSGNYTFKVRVADDGVPSLSDSKTMTVSLKAAAVVNGDLLVGGTARNDTIAVSPSKDLSQLIVTLNKAVVGVFPAANVTGKIVVHGLSGNDAISVSSKITKPAWLFGEAGNDRLTGGGGNNLLVGGDGNDTLTAKAGTNVLIGGGRADKLTGGGGNDLLIGGPTIYDADLTGLTNIVTEWTSGDSYSQRITDLTNGVNGTMLTAATVQDDFVKDTLSGKKKGNDWFIVSAPDKTDATAGETVTLVP